MKNHKLLLSWAVISVFSAVILAAISGLGASEVSSILTKLIPSSETYLISKKIFPTFLVVSLISYGIGMVVSQIIRNLIKCNTKQS